MAKKFLDNTGFSYFVSKIKTLLTGKADTNLGNVENSVFAEKATAAGAGVPIITTTAYDTEDHIFTATVPGVTTLKSGLMIILVPHTNSLNSAPSLNINGLGAKGIRRRLSNVATTVVNGSAGTWLAANKPFLIVYDGTYWIVEGQDKPAIADVYGLTATGTELNYMSGVTSAVQTQLDNINTALDGKAPTSHASTATTYGKGTSSNYGHVKLSASTSSTSGASSGVAATPSAVKEAYDAAVSVQNSVAGVSGFRIASGIANISYGASSHQMTINYGCTFSSLPVVLVSQVFDGQNICVKNNNITTTGFTCSTPSGFSSEGTRSFSWVAIGLA